MTPFVLLGMSCLLSLQPEPTDIALKDRLLAAKDPYQFGSNSAQPSRNLALLKGYKLPRGVRATHSGAIYIAGRRVVFYGVQDKKLLQLNEIGLDLNRNKVFERSEIAYLTDRKTKGSFSVYAFKNASSPLAFLSAYRTVLVQVSPARLMAGSGTIGGKKLDFTVTDTNYDGMFGAEDMVFWVNHNVRTQAVSSLFAMPDGRYYTASLPSKGVLRFTPDSRPTGTVSIKDGLIEASDISLSGNRFEPIYKDGSVVLPEGEYWLNVLAYTAKGTNGDPCRICILGHMKPYRISGGKDISLDPGPISRVGIRVQRTGKAFGLQLEAYTKGGYTVDDITFPDSGNNGRPSAPTVEIVDPSGLTVAKVTLKYG